MRKKIKDLELEHNDCPEILRQQASELEYSAEREEKLKKELEVDTSYLFISTKTNLTEYLDYPR